MNWGKSIALAFILFAAFIAVLVTVCVKQDVALVSVTYYQEDLQYQQQYMAVANANNLANPPEVIIENGKLLVRYTDFQLMKNAVLVLQRPSNKLLDKQLPLTETQTNQFEIPLTELAPGLYKIKLTWQQNNKGYAIDKTIVV
ncbi:MAG: FixH family protein [Cyclobacteriaceae bacterium]|jgi:hypothetical protein|nr:FixH family protein [Cyclobacteriaceae bacterium]